MEETFLKIFDHFGLHGEIGEIHQIQTGHINRTFVVRLNGKPYTVQSINTYVFPHPYDVMENILAVTDHIRKKLIATGGNPEREVLHFYTTEDGRGCWADENGEYWRVYDYIDDALTYDVADNLKILTDAGAAFGRFQKLLSDFPGASLHETIPNFHNTKLRFAALEQAIARDAAGRVESVKNEIEFFRNRTADASRLVDLIDAGKLPLRVTHNDTKFNNILIDKQTDRSICVIDLDTIMPGLAAYDFGDAIRFCTNSAAEDEQDITKVTFRMDKFEAFTAGFIGGADGFFSREELDSMVWGAILMTLECGCRFLTDYLDGDKYFHVAYPEHNRVRAHTQMKLAAEMERNFDEMRKIVERYAK